MMFKDRHQKFIWKFHQDLYMIFIPMLSCVILLARSPQTRFLIISLLQRAQDSIAQSKGTGRLPAVLRRVKSRTARHRAITVAMQSFIGG